MLGAQQEDAMASLTGVFAAAATPLKADLGIDIARPHRFGVDQPARATRRNRAV